MWRANNNPYILIQKLKQLFLSVISIFGERLTKITSIKGLRMTKFTDETDLSGKFSDLYSGGKRVRTSAEALTILTEYLRSFRNTV
jgi:hypothetical protein